MVFARPPTCVSPSKTMVGTPRRVRSYAAVRPAGPAPMTTTGSSAETDIGDNGRQAAGNLIILDAFMKRNRALATLVAAAILSAAPAVARAQVDPRTALVERDAWTALNAGQAHAAAEAFRSALAADPKNPRLHLGAGLAAALEKRDADARDEFERALALDPKLNEARLLLGQIEYRMGDAQTAIRTYETAVAERPDDT